MDETQQPYAYTGDDPVNGVDPSGQLGCGILAVVCHQSAQIWNASKSFVEGLAGTPRYCGTNGAAYDVGNVAWWTAAVVGTAGEFLSGGSTDDIGPTESAAVGAARVQQVVDYYGSDVAAVNETISVPGLGSTDVDVVLSDNTYIEVGGPAKALDSSKFGRQLQKVASYAESQGGTPMFLYAPGTPQSAIDLAVKWFGPENVGPIP